MSGIKKELEEIEIRFLLWFERHFRHHFHLNIHFNIKNCNKMALNALTITDTAVHTGLITVGDASGNTYQGTLANVVISDSDTTQDTAVPDPTAPNTIDVQAVTPKGGSTVNFSGDFTSQGNSTPAAGSTAIAIPDGTVFPGLKGTATLINALTSNTQLNLNVTF
jgi:hypothetical protein